MQRRYCSQWGKFLIQKGLISPAWALLIFAQPLLLLIVQTMFLGLNFFKGTRLELSYDDLIILLEDPDAFALFAAYFQEAGT